MGKAPEGCALAAEREDTRDAVLCAGGAWVRSPHGARCLLRRLQPP